MSLIEGGKTGNIVRLVHAVIDKSARECKFKLKTFMGLP